jgi:hypothetical protein
MNLTGKLVAIKSLSVNSYPGEATVEVHITQEIADDIFKNIGTYSLHFNNIFNGIGDPALLAAVNDKLALIPD